MEITIEEQYDKIYRYCYFKLHHRQRAEDITQETFLRFLETGSFQERGLGLPYLYTIARNLCIDEYRKKSFTELPEELEADSSERQWVDNLNLRIALEELESQEREMIFLRVVNEVPMADLSRFYGVSRFTLHREIKKILVKLERRMTDEPRIAKTVEADL